MDAHHTTFLPPTHPVEVVESGSVMEIDVGKTNCPLGEFRGSWKASQMGSEQSHIPESGQRVRIDRFGHTSQIAVGHVEY